MSWQVGATVLAAFTLMAWSPNANVAQDGSTPGGKAPDAGPHVHAPYRPRQVSQEFLSRLFPVKGRMYGDRRWLKTRLANPGFSQDNRPIEQFQDKEAAQHTCWFICSPFLTSSDRKSLDKLNDLQNSGIAFVYLPPDDFDRQHWDAGVKNSEGLGRHIVSFKRNDIFVTVVIQNDMIAFTFEYMVAPKKPEPPLAEIQKKIAAICPFLEHLVLEKFPPEEDDAGWAKAGLGKAKAKDPQRFNRDWVSSVRWWREPGRFGVASNIYKPNVPTGRCYRAPYLGK